jgi:hypothetical protein
VLEDLAHHDATTMVARTRIRREHLGKRSTSSPQVRFINKAQSTHLDRAKSAPLSSCPSGRR